MFVSWTPRAQAEFDGQIDYIAADNLSAAFRLRNIVLEHTRLLATAPRMGRRGRVANSYELVIAGTRYIAVYQLRSDTVEIVRFLHGAQQYPG